MCLPGNARRGRVCVCVRESVGLVFYLSFGFIFIIRSFYLHIKIGILTRLRNLTKSNFCFYSVLFFFFLFSSLEYHLPHSFAQLKMPSCYRPIIVRECVCVCGTLPKRLAIPFPIIFFGFRVFTLSLHHTCNTNIPYNHYHQHANTKFPKMSLASLFNFICEIRFEQKNKKKQIDERNKTENEAHLIPLYDKAQSLHIQHFECPSDSKCTRMARSEWNSHLAQPLFDSSFSQNRWNGNLLLLLLFAHNT